MASGDVTDIPIIQWSELQIEEIPIGRGGYGTVYRGKHPRLGIVAVKTLINSGQLPQKHIKVLQQEAQKLRELCQHEGILNLLALVMEKDNYSLILEYMPLGSLTEFRKEFSVQFPLFVRIAKEVISALDYLHSRNPQILHLDLKADNILLDKCISAKVSDFGLAEWKTVTMTQTRRTDQHPDERRCTVSHVPPEVWSNINKPSDRFFDIYSFGICVWEMLSGAVPYGNARDDLIRSAVLTGQRPDLTQIPKGSPPALVQLMTRCWQQKPSKRPAFSELKKEIDKVYDGEFKQQIVASLKAIRQEIVAHYPPDDPVNACTAEIDTLSDIPPEPEPMDQSEEPSTSQEAEEESTSTTQGEQAQPEDDGTNPYLTEPVDMKDEKAMDVFEKNLRQILRDPAALRIARSSYIDELFKLNKKTKEILRSNKKLKQYIESDSMFEKDIFFPGNDFWGNIAGGHLRQAKQISDNYTEAYKNELDGVQRIGRYGRHHWSSRNDDTERMRRRVRIDKMYDEHPHIRDMKKGGDYYRVKKALENPEQVEQLLREHETGQSTLKLTTLDPDVLRLCQDTNILMTVLHSEWQIMDTCTKKFPDLLMKLIAKPKIAPPPLARSRDLPMYPEPDMMREGMMEGMDPDDVMMMREIEMRRRRHHMMMDSDDEEDDFFATMAMRRQMMKEMRPRRMESSKPTSKMMKSSKKSSSSKMSTASSVTPASTTNAKTTSTASSLPSTSSQVKNSKDDLSDTSSINSEEKRKKDLKDKNACKSQ